MGSEMCIRDSSDMVANVMRAMLESWQNDLLKSVKGNMPETTRELLPLFKLIEKSPPTTAPKGGDNAKGKSNHGGGAAKKRSANNSDLRVPRKKPRFHISKLISTVFCISDSLNYCIQY